MLGNVAILFGLFGGSGEENTLETVANRLDAPADADAIAHELDHLSEAVDDLVADAGVERLPGDLRPDEGPVRKVEMLAEAVGRGTLSFDDPSAARSGRREEVTDTAEVADRLERRSRADAPDVRRLLDRLTTPEADAEAVAEALEPVVRKAAAASDAENALGLVDDGDEAQLRVARDSLAESPSTPLTDAVGELCELLAEERRRAREAREERRELERAVADAVGSADPNASPVEALRELADGRESESDASTAAAAVRRRSSPDSVLARELLDALTTGGDVEAVLERSVAAIDEAETARGLVESVDRDEVAALADGVEATAAESEGSVGASLEARAAELRRLLDGAPEANLVTPYTVRNELRFYDRTLLPSLREADSSPTASGDGDDPTERVQALVERRRAISQRRIEDESDYNHSIPLHFLSLADALYERASESLNAGEEERARGVAEAAEAVLDHVEALYERNEYSVMLRRLRG